MDDTPRARSDWEIDPESYRRTLEETTAREIAEGIRLRSRFFTVNDRPVRFVPLPDGGMDVEALNMQSGAFERDMSMLARCIGGHGDVDELPDAAAFDAYVTAFRKDHGLHHLS